MKVCFIGMCGHSKQAYKTLLSRADVQFCGVAPGSFHENMKESFDPAIPFFLSWKELLDTTKPDLAILSPVFGLGADIATECANRKINVFCEKPVAPTLEKLAELEAAVRASGIRFSAMHYLRTQPAFWQGAQMVRNGAIGKPVLVNAQKSYRFGNRPSWYMERDLFTGIIPWVGIHAIDWVYAFTGKKFLSVNALCFGKPERSAICLFEMEDSVSASVSLDYYRPSSAPTHDDDRIRCVGTEGVIEIRGGKIFIMNSDTVSEIEPESAPDIFEAFLDDQDIISFDEILYLTRVALLARDAADGKKDVKI